ncbi:MAG TPA: hypothetical protein VGL88_11030 [Pseudonocardiaceae bacterium]
MAVDLATIHLGSIMEPGKVDELMQVLELARDEAKKMAAACGVCIS